MLAAHAVNCGAFGAAAQRPSTGPTFGADGCSSWWISRSPTGREHDAGGDNPEAEQHHSPAAMLRLSFGRIANAMATSMMTVATPIATHTAASFAETDRKMRDEAEDHDAYGSERQDGDLDRRHDAIADLAIGRGVTGRPVGPGLDHPFEDHHADENQTDHENRAR